MSAEPMRTRVARVLAACAAALLSTACAGGDGGDRDRDVAGPSTTTGAAEPVAEGTISVFAAASLTDAFGALGLLFELAHPGVDVQLNFGPSSGLREQILSGAPADVFASANTSIMDMLVDAGAAADPAVFAANQLQIAVPAGNGAGVTGLADFADDDLLIGLCAEEVPCGQLGREALANAGVAPALDTNAPDVRALLTQIESGDLDAGLVYRTDLLAAEGAVEGVDIRDEQNVTAEYPIATLDAARNTSGAAAFVAFVLSPDGQEILSSFGFSEA